MSALVKYDEARAALAECRLVDDSKVVELRMSEKDKFVAEIKRVGDLQKEAMLATAILHYARSGHASVLMIEQAIELIDGHISYSREKGDLSWLRSSTRLKVGLEQALKDGIETLRMARGPGPEVRHVEEPLFHRRLDVGHQVRRQVRCNSGIIDIYDLTIDEIIECKHIGTSAALGEAAGQLQRYRKAFPGASLAIAVTRIEHEAEWLADVIRGTGIQIIEVSGESE